jgi:hypothetical protein
MPCVPSRKERPRYQFGGNKMRERSFAALRMTANDKMAGYWSLAYSAFASLRMGMVGSASFQSAKKS